MGATAQGVADRYTVRMAAREVCSEPAFRTRTASLYDLTPDVMEAFGTGEPQSRPERVAVF